MYKRYLNPQMVEKLGMLCQKGEDLLTPSPYPQTLFVVPEIIRAALESDDSELQRTAAVILSDNAASTYPGTGTVHYMPQEVRDWDLEGVPLRARFPLTTYLAKILRHLTIDSGQDVGRDTVYQISTVIGALRAASMKDESQKVRSNSLILLDAVLPLLSLDPDAETMEGHDGGFSYEELRTWVRDELPRSGPQNLWFVGLAAEIGTWWQGANPAGQDD